MQHCNHNSLSYDHSQVIYISSWEAKSGFPFLAKTFNPYVRKLQNIIALLHLSITCFSITYFIWCMTWYKMRQTHVSVKCQGAQNYEVHILSWTWFEKHGKPNFSSLASEYKSCTLYSYLHFLIFSPLWYL